MKHYDPAYAAELNYLPNNNVRSQYLYAGPEGLADAMAEGVARMRSNFPIAEHEQDWCPVCMRQFLAWYEHSCQLVAAHLCGRAPTADYPPFVSTCPGAQPA